MTMTHEAQFLTVQEAAELLGVTHWRIRQLQGKKEGKLTRFKIGPKRTVVSRRELLELVSATKRGKGAQK